MKTVAVFSIKGGVGKSAAAVNLSHAAATTGGRRTLLWDLDSQGAATWLLQREAASGRKARAALAGEQALSGLVLHSDFKNLHILPADRSLRRLEGDLARSDKEKQLRKQLKAFAESYDRILIDCPPGLSELAVRIFHAADLIVLPVIPTPLSERAAAQLQEELAAGGFHRPKLLPVWSMVDARRKLHRQTVASHPDWPQIPYSSTVEQMAVHRAPVAAFQPNGSPARAFAALWAQVEAALLR